MRIVFFTVLPSYSINEIIARFSELSCEVELVVTTRGLPWKISEKRLQLFQERITGVTPDVPTIVISNLRSIPSILAGVAPDLIFVQNFPFRLTSAILSIPSLGSINVHPSFLPQYRGPNPFGWQILNQEPLMGITFHRMDTEYDTGPIVLQASTPITEVDDYISLYERVPKLVIELLPKVIPLVKSGYFGEPQDHTKSSTAPEFTELQRTINWAMKTDEIIRLIRAAANEGAIAICDSKKLSIRRAERLDDSSSSEFNNYAPGTIIRDRDDDLVIATCDGYLRLIEHQTIV